MTLLAFMNLFPEFRAASWDAWRRVLAGMTSGTRELWAVCGRGSGKSRVAALLACWFAAREWRRAPGERIYVGVFAPDRKQAALTLGYVRGLLRSAPSLAALVVREATDSVELGNGVTVEVVTASAAAPRGRAYALAIVEEAAFLPTDDSAEPDVELLRALRPGLARVPGSLLAVLGSPYARRGELYAAARRYEENVPEHVLFVRRPTLDLNPTFDRREVERAYEEDPEGARSEYGAEFREDVAAYVQRAALDGAVVAGVTERAPVPPPREFWLRGWLHRPEPTVRYVAFVDPSGGSGSDGFAWGVAHRDEERGLWVLDAVGEVLPPFSPEAAVAEIAGRVSRYGLRTVTGDRYAGEWPREAFRKHGIEYRVSERTKSEIYREALPLLNSGRVELLDQPRLVQQLAGLERRVARGGKDSVDHAPGGHDDLANAACGALLAARPSPTAREVEVLWG